MSDAAAVLPADYLAWIRQLASEHRYGPGDTRGSANLIDATARARGLAAATTGASVGLARPLGAGTSRRGDGHQQFHVEVFYTDGPIGMGSDHVELDCHGIVNTHIDWLNHIAVDGTFYGGRPVPGAAGAGREEGDPSPGDEEPSLMELTEGLVTRAVHVDVPALRGTPWVDPDRPVTAEDLDGALRRAGVTFEAGDALLLDMGRDRFEAAGHRLPAEVQPGIGASGARWIAEHEVSLLCWDFLDSNHPAEPLAAVHMLNWAIGLLLVDNCDHQRVRAALGPDRATAALVVNPLPIAGATGGNVNPIVIL